jgi:hypothetical protein
MRHREGAIRKRYARFELYRFDPKAKSQFRRTPAPMYCEYVRCCGLRWPNVGGSNHFAPLLSFSGYEAGKIGR